MAGNARPNDGPENSVDVGMEALEKGVYLNLRGSINSLLLSSGEIVYLVAIRREIVLDVGW